MWWCRRRSVGVLAAALLLAGCGFQPLYGRSSDGAVDDELASVKVQVIADRLGQQVHNYLLDRVNRKGRPASPRYLLTVGLTLHKTRLGIERDETATRAKLELKADFRLSSIENEEVLVDQATRSTTSYNIVDSAIATRSAELDAADRAAREVSENIRLALALYFRKAAAEAMAAQ